MKEPTDTVKSALVTAMITATIVIIGMITVLVFTLNSDNPLLILLKIFLVISLLSVYLFLMMIFTREYKNISRGKHGKS